MKKFAVPWKKDSFQSKPNALLLYANLVLVPYVREVCKNVETKSSTCV